MNSIAIDIKIQKAVENLGIETYPNPLLSCYHNASRIAVELHESISSYYFMSCLRDYAVQQWAWAIPSTEAIKTLVAHSPIVEIGAGMGYWAKLVHAAGGTIEAFDSCPNRNNTYHKKTYRKHFPVQQAQPNKLLAYPDHTLLLCWPPYENSMAINALQNYRGNKIVYIGETAGGCTANDAFFAELDQNWHCEQEVDIPQWRGIHDAMYVYARNPTC